MVRVGIVGVGFMGMIHYLAYQRAPGMKVRAIVSRDEKKLAGDWRGIQGNFGPPGAKMDLKGVTPYRDLDALLADPDIDLVDICLPPALHAEAAVQALAAGKHVLCEKPISVSAADANRMVRAAEKHGKQLLIGHVLPYFPEYEYAVKIIQSGKYGRMLGGHFKRIISNPEWLSDFYDPVQVGGPLVDLHIHDAHLIRMLRGMPTALFSRGRMRGEVVEFATTQFQWEDPSLVVSATSGVIHQQARSFTHGYEIYLEKATLMYDFAAIGGEPTTLTPVTVLAGKKIIRPKLGSGDPLDSFAAELKEARDAVRGSQSSAVLGGELARDALELCHRQTESVLKGKPVRISSPSPSGRGLG